MIVFLKAVIMIFVYGSLIYHGNCDDTIELSCSLQEDCRSYEDKFTLSICSEENSVCLCSNRKTGEKISCTPKTIVSNLLSPQECSLYNTENSNGKCITRVVSLGKSCDLTRQCFRGDKMSECHLGVCECKKNFLQISKVCRSLVMIEKCTENKHCTDNAECYEQKCVCNNGFISSSDFKECLPFAIYNSSCIENIQCEMGLGIGSVCEDKLCKCNSSYIPEMSDSKEMICVPKKYAGDSCANNLDCSNETEPKMICESSKCKCAEKYKIIVSNGRNECEKLEIRSLPMSSAASSLKNMVVYLVALSTIASLLVY